jgi:PhzF family phenazine biosynthesis protein
MSNFSIHRVAAFSDDNQGGNPAGVWLGAQLPSADDMQRLAQEVGYSETVFACRTGDGWRVRYFSPESEVPFCGHATIALGAVLAQNLGDGIFDLQLNQGKISVEGRINSGKIFAALQSPATRSAPAAPELLKAACDLFGLRNEDLNPDIPPALIHGGADHLILALRSRETLRAMHYDLDTGRRLMKAFALVTIMLVFAESRQLFHSRNAFASGGVLEDPATGAATAAFAGYLRDLYWLHGGEITLIQGEDMGMRSLIHAQITDEAGASIRVYGAARIMG